MRTHGSPPSSTQYERPIGIMGAMPAEVQALASALDPLESVVEHGRRSFHFGRLNGLSVIVVGSRIGKVAAAATAAELIVRFGVRAILFTGVAGSLNPELRVGDVVVADRLVQHDLDASPLFPALEVPLLGRSWFEADPGLVGVLHDAAIGFLAEELPRRVPADVLARLCVGRPVVRVGAIATGDRFVASGAVRREVIARVPEALCVEMEGAAAAQVSHEYGVAFAVVRTISDAADDQAAGHFPAALEALAGAYGLGIVGWAAGLLANAGGGLARTGRG